MSSSHEHNQLAYNMCIMYAYNSLAIILMIFHARWFPLDYYNENYIYGILHNSIFSSFTECTHFEST